MSETRYFVRLPEVSTWWQPIEAQLYCDYLEQLRAPDLSGLEGVQLAALHVGPIPPQKGDLDGELTAAELEAIHEELGSLTPEEQAKVDGAWAGVTDTEWTNAEPMKGPSFSDLDAAQKLIDEQGAVLNEVTDLCEGQNFQSTKDTNEHEGE